MQLKNLSFAGLRNPAALLQPGTGRNVFQKSGQHRRALFANRCGQEHAFGLQPLELARREIGDDDDLAPDKLLRGLLLGDAGNDLPRFRPEIDFQPH